MPLHKENKCYIFHSLPWVMQSKSMQLNSQLAMATHIRLLVVRLGYILYSAPKKLTQFVFRLHASGSHTWLRPPLPPPDNFAAVLHCLLPTPLPDLPETARARASGGRICICSRCGAAQAGPVGSSCCRSRCTASGRGAHIHWARSGSSGRPSGLRRINSLPLGHLPTNS